MRSFILASTKTWNIDAFTSRRQRLPGKWLVVAAPEDLTIELVRAVAPRYIFFMHWSSIVPDAVLAASGCAPDR